MATNTRNKFDDKTKSQTVVSILKGELPITDAARQHGLQSYQLHAWIGQVAMERPELIYEALEHRFGKLHGDTGVFPPGAGVVPAQGDLTTAVMAAYLRKVLGTPDKQ